MFRADPEAPEPEELKRRFRARVMRLTLLGCVVLLAIPVTRDRIPAIESARAARLFAEFAAESEYLVALNRAPVLLTLDKSAQTWKRLLLPAGAKDCSHAEESHTPAQSMEFPAFRWEILSGTKHLNSICFHPLTGPSVEGADAETLLVTVSPLEDLAQNREDRARTVELSLRGSRILLGTR